jgi:glyceraldehyde-3-phosphate dehydrogenase/erythrose-4-phosphate dehydrogenase
MPTRIGINGFGRMGRLALRAGSRASSLSLIPTTTGSAAAVATSGPLKGILGYEKRPLVSVDVKDDPRSSIIDAPSTMVVDGTCVKVLAWYDNEIRYVNRMIELAQKVGASL